MLTEYSPLTWGIFTEPPADIPECGFVGELCPSSTRGKSPYRDIRKRRKQNKTQSQWNTQQGNTQRE